MRQPVKKADQRGHEDDDGQACLGRLDQQQEKQQRHGLPYPVPFTLGRAIEQQRATRQQPVHHDQPRLVLLVLNACQTFAGHGIAGHD